MTRKEKRIRNEQRRTDLALVIAEKLKAQLDVEISARVALDCVDEWCHDEIRKHPQEKQLYIDAIHIVQKAINKTSKERGRKDAECNNS